MKLYHVLMELLFPPKCVLCRQILKNGEIDLCADCRINAPEYPNGKIKLQFLDSFAAVWYYEGNVRASLLRYKFHNAQVYSVSYGRILAMKLLREYPDGFDVLTWVPVSRLRKLRRGYDQVELLARAVGNELGMNPVPTLKKIRNNRPQSRLKGAEARKANVLGAYRILENTDVKGKRVALLDDILTTGATAGECARILLSAGAKEVHCAAVAAARK
ncbi:MAG: ComF family protein [Eubacteriales bacterium]|nr:ComF family protein [Eubacteriales bacterium]